MFVGMRSREYKSVFMENLVDKAKALFGDAYEVCYLLISIVRPAKAMN